MDLVVGRILGSDELETTLRVEGCVHLQGWLSYLLECGMPGSYLTMDTVGRLTVPNPHPVFRNGPFLNTTKLDYMINILDYYSILQYCENSIVSYYQMRYVNIVTITTALSTYLMRW